jgi:predicted dinucleotide-binding enzyme
VSVGAERSKIMRVAVIGAGNVGKALGEALGRKGHDVVYGVRDAKRSDVNPAELDRLALSVALGDRAKYVDHQLCGNEAA